jgi:hypothetical protein
MGEPRAVATIMVVTGPDAEADDETPAPGEAD